MRYFVSDLHLFHKNILNFCRSKYNTLDEMHKDIISIWNAHVKPEDTVYNLGDIAFQAGTMKGEINGLLYALNGKHILIKGNHDEDKKIANFPSIVEYHRNLVINIHDRDFLLSHFPFKHAMPEKDKIERPECFTPDSDMILINGHVHEKWAIRKNCINVGWDIWGRPISEEEIWKIFEYTDGFSKDFDNAIWL